MVRETGNSSPSLHPIQAAAVYPLFRCTGLTERLLSHFSCIECLQKKKKKSVSHIKTPQLFLSAFVDFYKLCFVDCSLMALTLFRTVSSYFLQFTVDFFRPLRCPTYIHLPTQSKSTVLFFSPLSLEVNRLKCSRHGQVFLLSFKSCGPTSRQRRPVRLHSTHETFSFYGFPLTINWGYGSIEEMNRQRPIAVQTGSCSFLSNLSCPEL